jgi:hypothetical protein
MVFVQAHGREVMLIPGPTPDSPMRLHNARRLIYQLTQKPSDADIPRIAKEWAKKTWFTAGDQLYCTRDLCACEVPHHSNWLPLLRHSYRYRSTWFVPSRNQI